MKAKRKWAKEASFKLDLINSHARLYEKGFVAGVERARIEVLRLLIHRIPLNKLLHAIESLGETNE